jgi:hypothetical protein
MQSLGKMYKVLSEETECRLYKSDQNDTDQTDYGEVEVVTSIYSSTYSSEENCRDESN